MGIKLTLSKDRATELIMMVTSNKPVAPDHGEWSPDECLCVAGALLVFANDLVRRQIPKAHKSPSAAAVISSHRDRRIRRAR